MGLKILVVEDDHVVAENLKLLLEASGATVQTAHDGTTGLRMALKGGYELLLLDVMLPNKLGYDVCKEFKAVPKNKKIPVLMITALAKMDDAEKAFSAGADGYVIKPVEPARLLKKIEEVLPKRLG